MKKTLTRSYSPSDAEMYDYPEYYIQKPDGEHYALARIDEGRHASNEATHGTTNARGLATGHTFKLKAHPRDDQNQEYVVLAAKYSLNFSEYESQPDATPGAHYQCSFLAMPTSQQFRPKRITPKPFVQGPQTAVVVGPAGEEIFTDKYGRVKVQFHWDRQGKNDENSSCWMRSQPWAGKNWGAIPSPHRPGGHRRLPRRRSRPADHHRSHLECRADAAVQPAGNKTQTGIKSRSSMGGSPANFNELRFEDKKGSEQVFLHAEKNEDIEVEHDETHWVGHDRSKKVDHDETTHVKHDRTETVDNNETITDPWESDRDS